MNNEFGIGFFIGIFATCVFLSLILPAHTVDSFIIKQCSEQKYINVGQKIIKCEVKEKVE